MVQKPPTGAGLVMLVL
jgi:hypothetical protein